ncbi:MAG: histidine kinase [Anaerolineales bacterium]
MQRADSPFVTDWYVVSLRWFVLVGMTLSVAASDSLISFSSLLLFGLTGWNLFLSWMAGQNRRLKSHRGLSVAIDLACAIAFFLLEGTFIGPAAWVVMIPLVSGSLYYNFKGGILTALVMSLVEVAGGLITGKLDIFSTAIGVILTLLLGVVFGFISQQLYKRWQDERKKQIAAREKQQRVENDRLRAIYNLSSALTSTLSYKRVMDSALDLSVNALHVEENDPEGQVVLGNDRIVSAILLFRGEELTVGSARRFTQADMRATFPAKAGLLAKVIEEGDALTVGSVASDPELGRIVGLSNCKSVYCFPLRSGFNVYGAMLFGHPDANYFTRERSDILGIIGRQAIIAIQNARLYQDLADEKERITEVQEEARKKLARDLHDGPTQSVAAMAMRVNLARRMIDRDTNAAKEELEKIEDLARRTTKEIRHMLFTLRPLVLESQGLKAALQAMADKMKETYGQEVIIQVDEKLAEQLEMGKSGVIFYIAEEAVNNARKHAQASHIWVRLNALRRQPEIAQLEISDDGVGFDVNATMKSYDKRGSLGMINLRERAELVNGLLNIESAPGRGTKIQVYIPLTEEAADMLHHARERQQEQAA